MWGLFCALLFLIIVWAAGGGKLPAGKKHARDGRDTPEAPRTQTPPAPANMERLDRGDEPKGPGILR